MDVALGVRVFGNVPDVRPYIASASVYVVPLRIGSGVKVKIIEALAMGKAIVATPIAAEGMGLKDDHDLNIMELGDEFVDAVVRLFKDEGQRSRLEANARETAVRLFSFATGSLELDAIYRQLAEISSKRQNTIIKKRL